MPIIFKSLSYVYDEAMPFRHIALDNVNLEITEGKITAVIGETGSGKSTMMQHLNALLLPTSGELEVLDYTIKAKEKTKGLKGLRRQVGLVFQFSEYQLFEESIIKDVAFGPMNFGVSQQEAYQRAAAALKLVGIPQEMFNQSPLDLSGGQKRRVAMAGIIAIDPSVIVLDEPTAGLDPAGAKDIINLFMSLNKKLNKTIIIVSHDNDMVYNFADEVVLISKGKIVKKDETVSFFNDDEMLEKYEILKPQIVDFKNRLIKKGFKIDPNARTIAQVVKGVRR